MEMLVDIETAKGHLNIVFDDSDADIALKIRAVSNVIRDYVGADTNIYQEAQDSTGEAETLLDDNGEPIVRYDVQAACLLLLGEMYRSREGNFQETPAGHLPPAVVSLLNMVRDRVVA